MKTKYKYPIAALNHYSGRYHDNKDSLKDFEAFIKCLGKRQMREILLQMNWNGPIYIPYEHERAGTVHTDKTDNPNTSMLNVKFYDEYYKKLTGDHRFEVDDILFSIDDDAYTGRISYSKLKDDYEIEFDATMPENWEEIEDDMQNQLADLIYRLTKHKK